MKKLHEIIKEKTELTKELSELRVAFEKNADMLKSKISDLERLEKIGTSIDAKLDLEKIQIAESVLIIGGNPIGKNINRRAILKIANNPEYLQTNFIGNKRYEGFYQECDCEYGYGPRHGNIVDRIGLKSNARSNGISEEQRDACIYYLTNIKQIIAINEKVCS